MSDTMEKRRHLKNGGDSQATIRMWSQEDLIDGATMILKESLAYS